MKNIVRSAIKQIVEYALKSSSLRHRLYRLAFRSMELDFTTESEAWRIFDPIYTRIKRRLIKEPLWRYNPQFVRVTAKSAYDALVQHVSIKDKTYCEIGCGEHHPYGTSAIMYINGASSAIATDLKNTDKKRAAEALYDLLLDCLAHPEDWHWSGLSRDDYLKRIYSFNLKVLREGDLDAGIAAVPIKHVITNIYEPAIQPDSIDVMSSRAVLEHFLDFELACKKLYSLMSTDSIAYHNIDLVDHRGYDESLNHHWWSFLAEDENWSGDSCNRLRSSEIREYFEKTGFEILSYDDRERHEMPAGFRGKLKGRFKKMSDEELSIMRIACVLRKTKFKRT